MSRTAIYLGLSVLSPMFLACGNKNDAALSDTGVTTSGTSSASSGSGTGDAETTAATGSTTSNVRFDLPELDQPNIAQCKPGDDSGDAPPPCGNRAEPDSFAPEVQWTWGGMDDEVESTIIPLVANLTDDNQDGEIDLCDVPDVVVVATNRLFPWEPGSTHLYVLDGATGNLHFRIEWGNGTTTTNRSVTLILQRLATWMAMACQKSLLAMGGLIC